MIVVDSVQSVSEAKAATGLGGNEKGKNEARLPQR
jgi:hypothetical protein